MISSLIPCYISINKFEISNYCLDLILLISAVQISKNKFEIFINYLDLILLISKVLINTVQNGYA